MATVNRDNDRAPGLFFNLGLKYQTESGEIKVQQAGFGTEWRSMPDCTGTGAEAKNEARNAFISWLEGKCKETGKYTLTAEDLQLFEFTVVDMSTYNPESSKSVRKFLISEE